MVCHQTDVVGWVTPGLKPIAPQGVGQWWPAVMGTWTSSDSDREGMTHLFVGPLSCSRSGCLTARRSPHKKGCQAHAYLFRKEGTNEDERPFYWSAGRIFSRHVSFLHPRCGFSNPRRKIAQQEQSSVASQAHTSVLSERTRVRGGKGVLTDVRDGMDL